MVISVGRKSEENSDTVLPPVTTSDVKFHQSVTYRDDQVNTTLKSIYILSKFRLLAALPAACRLVAGVGLCKHIRPELKILKFESRGRRHVRK
jgi:hypothetical protein